MDPALPLPPVQRLKLFRQRLLAALAIGGNVAVRVEETADGAFIHVDGRRIRAASPLRWKLYRKGWTARLDALAREYGVGRHVTLGADSVVLDIGANAGEFAHVCARHGAKVYCFEPDPAAFAALKANLAGLPNAEAMSDAVWKEDGAIAFALASERADSSVFAEGPRIEARAITIDAFARARGLSRIDLIKCDAEGAEPEVLEGIGESFPIVRAVALDTGPERRGARTQAECAAILRAQGFDVIDEKVGARLMTYGVRPAHAQR